jgi:hypothetical protein
LDFLGGSRTFHGLLTHHVVAHGDMADQPADIDTEFSF